MRPTNKKAAFFMVRFLSFFILLYSSSVFPQMQGYAYNADGSSTYYRIYGSGAPLLIINGGPGMNSNGFESLAEHLAPNNKVILYDQRGTGKSAVAVSKKTISIDIMVDDIETLRKHLKIKKWIVLGHSFGGMLASYYATKHPSSFESLILSSSGGVDLGLLDYVGEAINSKLTKTELDSLQYYNAQLARGNSAHAIRLGRGRMLAPAYVYHKKFIPMLAERLTQGNAEINTILWNDMRRLRFDCKPTLQNFKSRVLIIQGKDDIIRSETAYIAASAFKNSEVVLLDNCGHYGWLDAQDAYLNVIATFLR